MPKLIEFYPELQGRPESKVALDMDKRGPSTPPGFIDLAVLKGGDEYVKTEDLATIVNAFIEYIEKLRIEMIQIKLHLASLSDENIEGRDAQ